MAAGSERLGPEAWVAAAFSALAKGGLEAVRVEPLAERLGVTKGSFYWHFEDRRALLDAMLDAWELLATNAIIARVDSKPGTPKERLSVLMNLTTSVGEGAPVEHAIRAWGATDASVRRRLVKVDETRQAYVRDLLVGAGLTPARATARSRILYLALIGEFTWVSLGGAPSGAALWKELYGLLTDE